MKKIVILFAALTLTPHLFSEVDIDKVEEAIEKSHIATVRAAMAKLKHSSLTLAEKKKHLENFYDSAAEQVDLKKENVSLFGSWKDLAKTTFGSLFIICGLSGMAFAALLDQSHPLKRHADDAIMKISGLTALAGLPLLYKGFTCSSQKAEVKKAEEVEQTIEASYNEIEALIAQTK